MRLFACTLDIGSDHVTVIEEYEVDCYKALLRLTLAHSGNVSNIGIVSEIDIDMVVWPIYQKAESPRLTHSNIYSED